MTDDDEPCRRSCGDCENLQLYAGVPICICTGRETGFFHDATECGAFCEGCGSDAEEG
jgi:hypothetical protein